MLYCAIPLPRALLSSRRSMLPVHANVAPILPSSLSDVSQVAVNRPQATSHKGMGIPQSGKSGILGFGIQNQRLSLIPLHGAIQWKNQANQTVQTTWLSLSRSFFILQCRSFFRKNTAESLSEFWVYPPSRDNYPLTIINDTGLLRTLTFPFILI